MDTRLWNFWNNFQKSAYFERIFDFWRFTVFRFSKFWKFHYDFPVIALNVSFLFQVMISFYSLMNCEHRFDCKWIFGILNEGNAADQWKITHKCLRRRIEKEMERCEDIPSDDYVPQISQIGDPMGGGGGGGNYMGKKFFLYRNKFLFIKKQILWRDCVLNAKICNKNYFVKRKLINTVFRFNLRKDYAGR